MSMPRLTSLIATCFLNSLSERVASHRSDASAADASLQF